MGVGAGATFVPGLAALVPRQGGFVTFLTDGGAPGGTSSRSRMGRQRQGSRFEPSGVEPKGVTS